MKKILVVDDNKDIVWVVETILKRYGFQVSTTLNGEDVLKSSQLPSAIGLARCFSIGR